MMKKNILVRILAALGGLTLWMMGLCALAETFFKVQITARLGQLLGAHTPVAVLITLLLAILLCAFGVSCWMMLSTKRAAKRTGFVMQKGENGAIGVSVRSIEGLVQTCIRQHEVVAKAEISVVERRDGIVILLDIEEAAGVNIPLSVGALQKQIKQYVNACTGVDVREVRVLVENTESPVGTAAYAVQEPVVMAAVATEPSAPAETAPVAAAAAPLAAPVEEVVMEAAPVEETPQMPVEEPNVVDDVVEEAPLEEAAPALQAVPVAMPVIPELPEEEDDRPLHQRLFGVEEEPVFVPAPPELTAEPAVEEIPVEAAEIAEEVVEEAAEESADAFEGDAVLEVVAAMAEEANTEEYQIPEEQEELPKAE